MKDAVASAREKERRRRRGGPLRVAGLCSVPKALAPVLPVYLQGVLQVRGGGGVFWTLGYRATVLMAT